MESELWTVRMKSFGISALSLFGTAFLAVLMSDQFLALIQQYLGTSVLGTIFVLVVPEVVKHYRNKFVLGKARARLGAHEPMPRVMLL